MIIVHCKDIVILDSDIIGTKNLGRGNRVFTGSFHLWQKQLRYSSNEKG